MDGYTLQDYVPQANIAGSYPITGAHPSYQSDGSAPAAAHLVGQQHMCVCAQCDLANSNSKQLTRPHHAHLNSEASAAKAPDGSLVAHFTADLPKTPDQILGSKFNIIYAVGPLAPDGGLLPHPASNRPYGGTALQLRQASGAGAAPAAEAPSPSAPAAASAPVAATPGGFSTAPAPERDRAVTSSGCQLSLNGRQLSFSACTHLDGIGSDTTLMWSLRPLGEHREDGK